MPETTGSQEEGALTSENWLTNWKTHSNLLILNKQKLVRGLFVCQGLLYLCYGWLRCDDL
jgi:hypothetical protein